jgi:hypothetical protein
MRIWWALALCACSAKEPATPMTPEEPDDPPEETALAPGVCSGAEISLYGMGSSQATEVPVTAMPTTLCLALDGRDNIRIAHFAAGTPYEQATKSSFKMALFGADDALLRAGWDVQFSTNVFHNLEYGAPIGAVTHVKLVVDGTGATEVDLHLFEPYE